MREAEVRSKLYKAFFWPFAKLANDGLTERLNIVEDHISNGKYKTAIVSCEHIMKLVSQGRVYYQNYFQSIVLVNVTVGVVLWLVLLGLVIVSKFFKNKVVLWVTQRRENLKIASVVIKSVLVPLILLIMFFTFGKLHI